jgi:zinc-binding in reverse transcriptase
MTKNQLAKKGWIGDAGCIMCGGAQENADHLLLHCEISEISDHQLIPRPQRRYGIAVFRVGTVLRYVGQYVGGYGVSVIDLLSILGLSRNLFVL